MVFLNESPRMFGDLSEFNNIAFPVYRVAMKLRYIQKKTKLCHVTVSMWKRVVEEYSLENPNLVLQPAEINSAISMLFQLIMEEENVMINREESCRILLSWLSSLYPQPTLTALQLNVPLILLCRSETITKQRMLFEVAILSGYELTLQQLSHLLHLASYLVISCSEKALLGATSSQSAAQCCYTFNKLSFHSRLTLEQYESWLLSDPEYLAWLPTLHRLNISQEVRHDVNCGICKCCPILGLRYRCLRCINLDICQACFLSGRPHRGHDLSHPLKEYLTQGTKSDSIRDIKTAVKTIFKPRPVKSTRPASALAQRTSSFEQRISSVPSKKPAYSVCDSQEYTVSSEEWFNRKGQLPTQAPLNQYTSCPTLVEPNNHHQIQNLEKSHSKLAAQVKMLRAQMSDHQGSVHVSPPPAYSREYSVATPVSSSYNHSQSYSVTPLQTIAEIADSFTADMDVYSGESSERHPVISGASQITFAMDSFLGEMFRGTPPPKPKRTSPNRSKSSTPASTPPPPSPRTSVGLGGAAVDLELSYDIKNRSRPGTLQKRPSSAGSSSTEPGRVPNYQLPPKNSTPCPSGMGLDISFTCTSISSLAPSTARHAKRRVSTPPMFLHAMDSETSLSRSQISRNYRGSSDQLNRDPFLAAKRHSLAARSVV